jgi:HK97 family phage prohead protease
VTAKPEITRTVDLLDYEIARDGDGRTVTAYAATFGNLYEVTDSDGHYDEVINSRAFNQAIKRGAVRTAQVHFNHGLTLWGTPSDKWTEPIGTPVEIRAETRGLLTVTRYGRTPAGEEALQMWKDGMVRGQSFRGAVYRSARPKSGPNDRPIIERLELGLREYGPTPNPANIEAGLVAVRSQLLADVGEMTPEERRELAALLAETPGLGDDHRVPALIDPAAAPVVTPEDDPSIELLELANANRRRRTI